MFPLSFRWLTAMLLTFLGAAPAFGVQAPAPHEIGGFSIGSDVSSYGDRVLSRTALPVRYAEFITEAEVQVPAGFKTGIIAYGSCAYPGKILRLKFKYANDSREFFEELVRRMKARFGQKPEWRGDPFQNVMAWKWSFRDTEGKRVTLIVQHNQVDSDERIGNTVKLTWMDAVEQERSCYERKHPEGKRQREAKKRADTTMNASEWEALMPK